MTFTVCGDCRLVNEGPVCTGCGGRCLEMPTSAPRVPNVFYGPAPAPSTPERGPLVQPNT